MQSAQHTANDPAQHADVPDYAVLRWLVGATFVVILNETIMINAIPRLMVDFAVNANAAQWLSTAFMLTMAVVIPVTGWFLQRVTTRFAFGLAMGVFCAGTLLAAAAWTFPVLLVARVIQASGTAVMMPLLMTTLMAVVPMHDRGRVMGNVTLAISVAPALGPAVSGVILQSLSWRWIFLAVLPIAGGIGLLGLRRLVNVGEPVAGRVDWWSVVIAAVGFGSLVYGLSEVGVPGDHSPAYAAMLVGVVGIACFIRRQLVLQRSDRPLLDLRTLRVRVFSVSLGVMAMAFMAMLGSMILLQLYLQNVRGMSPLATGMLVMPGGLAMGLLGPRVGRVYDVRGARVLVIPGAIGLLASMTAFVALDANTPTWQILIAHVLLMVSLAALFTPVFTMGLGSLPPHLYSHGSSLLGTTQQVAGAMGTALVVTVMSSRATSLIGDGVAPVVASLEGLRWAFAVGAGLCVVVLGLVTMLPARIADPDSDGNAQPDAASAVEVPEPV
ncbi:MAG TPA: MDR family MFS transporter [Nocardioidaceae bacterium]|nr:MDR family MFS transporter [Nocardioidaceae bacterium]